MNIGNRHGLFGSLLVLGLVLASTAIVMTSNTSVQASTDGFCDRTQQVRDAILAKLSNISNCADVTNSNLMGITEIIILDQETLTLQDGDFAGLSKLDSLYIHKNGLNELPEDLFDGLSALRELYLYNNELTTLPSELFDGLSSLETLSLSYNNLDTLPSDVFDGLSGLKTLDLDNNDLDELPDGVFDELSGLEKLNLTSNSLEDVSHADLDDLANLKDLRLGANDLGELPSDLLEGLTSLQTLHLYSAGLNELPDALFNGLSSLKSVILHSNPGAPFTLKAVVDDWEDGGVVIKVVETTPFDMKVTLSAEGGTLSASTVSIAGGTNESEKIAVTPATTDGDVTITVESAAFQEGVYQGIQAGAGEPVTVSFPGICGRTQEVQDAILALLSDVNNCANITDSHLAGITAKLIVIFASSQTIKSGDFAGLTSLTQLQLHSNHISALPEDLFEDLDSLEGLIISFSQLQELPEDVFEGLGKLKELSVSIKPLVKADEGKVIIHQLSALPEDVFDGLNSLEGLNLSKNQLTALPEDVFDGLDSLQRLNLVHNQISALPESVFDGLDSLESLHLNYNQLTTLPKDVYDGLGNLDTLGLSHNQITGLPEDVFDGLASLSALDVSNNQITTLPEDVFDGLASLIFLEVSYNQITTLPEDVFDGLSNLLSLYVSNNRISGLSSEVFDGLSRLVTLTLENNQISTLPDELFSGLSNLAVLYLGNNPGTTFTFTAELEQQGDNGVVVKIAVGAPFDMAVTLKFQASTLSSTLAVPVSGGDLTSGVITSPVSDDDGVTVTVVAAVFLEGSHQGIQTSLGGSLTLASSSTDGDSENTPAAGAPTISGTAQVGQTLTATTTGISDANGLDNVSYSYQWLADDTEIDGATSSTYEVQPSDDGKVIKVQVTFTDDAGNEESLTSVGTTAVVTGGL